MTTPKWLDDLDFKAANMPFGEVEVKIIRHRSKTSKVIYSKDYNIVPKSNVEAFSDLQKLLNGMINGDFAGKVEFALDIKSGTIQLITIKNKEIIHYGERS